MPWLSTDPFSKSAPTAPPPATAAALHHAMQAVAVVLTNEYEKTLTLARPDDWSRQLTRLCLASCAGLCLKDGRPPGLGPVIRVSALPKVPALSVRRTNRQVPRPVAPKAWGPNQHNQRRKGSPLVCLSWLLLTGGGRAPRRGSQPRQPQRVPIGGLSLFDSSLSFCIALCKHC